MAKSGKKYLIAREQVDANQLLVSKDAVAKVKSVAFAKFDESVDVNINLGIDATQGDQVVRGSVILPFGNGRTVKVAVFAKGDFAAYGRAQDRLKSAIAAALAAQARK